MKLARSAVLMLALATAVGACDDDDDPTGNNNVTVAELAGSYDIDSFIYTADDGSGSFNLTPVGLGLQSITVQTNGNFSGVLVFPDPQTGNPTPFNIGGTIVLSGSNGLTINFDQATQALGILDASETGTFTWNENLEVLVLTLTEVTAPAGTPGFAGEDSNLTMTVTRM